MLTVENNHLQFRISVFRISGNLTRDMSRLLLRICWIFGLFDPFYDTLPDVLALAWHKLLILYSTSRYIALKNYRINIIYFIIYFA